MRTQIFFCLIFCYALWHFGTTSRLRRTPPIHCVAGGELGLRFMHYEPRRAQRGLPELIILYRWLCLR